MLDDAIRPERDVTSSYATDVCARVRRADGTVRAPCASTCSPGSTRRRSTAAPGSTSSTWPASCAGSPTCGCTASARRATEPGVTAYAEPAGPGRRQRRRCAPSGVDLEMAAGCAGTDLVHSHTWYANLAGHIAKLLHGVPHVVTAHSLEPLRPWKAEQLGGGYALSSWCERTAHRGGRRGHRGLRRACAATCSPRTRRSTRTGSTWSTTASTPTQYAPDHGTDVLDRLGIDPDRPERGLRRPDHPPEGPALPAARGPRRCRPTAQLVLLAGAPDTPEIAAEVEALVDELRADRDGRRLGRGDAAQARGRSRCSPTPRSSSARPSTSRWASSTWRRWPARRRWWPPPPAASPRWSPTARPACWCPIEQAADGTGTPAGPGPVRRRPGRGDQRAAGRPGAGRRDGPGRPAAGGGALLLGRRRRAHHRGVPVGAERAG